ncbi:hypothetical protein [Pseudoalteromonas maricaloris]|uniref:Uncharacterized protein n=1 Tax=Pseudoalteromonas maricaloris TaxID=184924 RepID=A0A8I2H640_9GAMM|nr:hypothetical protein [Pseudoalteromonas maricaloris]NLR20881.1 hypothetical protein [Pseudoalteromonas maricaloris]WOX30880.1 hypothetical protein R5H13_23670 [Pseudoalteromonas maricaloris]
MRDKLKSNQSVLTFIAILVKKIVEKVMETEGKKETQTLTPSVPVDKVVHDRPIEETPLLKIEDSIPRDFNISKGMQKVDVNSKADFVLQDNDVLSSNQRIALGGADFARVGKLANVVFAYMASIFALVCLPVYLKESEPHILYLMIGLVVFASFVFYRVHRIKHHTSEVLRVDFFRNTGLVTFPIGNNEGSFSLTLDEVELYIVKVSSGKGVRHNLAFLAPLRYPKTLKRQTLYSTDWEPKDMDSSVQLWSEIHRFMDTTQPIPSSFYKGWQETIESPYLDHQDHIQLLGEDLVKQAPFYDLKNNRPLDKVFW